MLRARHRVRSFAGSPSVVMPAFSKRSIMQLVNGATNESDVKAPLQSMGQKRHGPLDTDGAHFASHTVSQVFGFTASSLQTRF